MGLVLDSGVLIAAERDARPVKVYGETEVVAAIPVEPFTKEMARIAAKIDADAGPQARSRSEER